jgi:hypothetical protein
MSISDIFRVGQIKAELAATTKERDELRASLEETGQLEIHELKQRIAELHGVEADIRRGIAEQERAHQDKIQQLGREIEELTRSRIDKESELVQLDDEILLQSFGLYKPRYALADSDAYRSRLELVPTQQADMVKAGHAVFCASQWTVGNSRTEGERMIKDNTKLITRSFNNECDASIVKVTFSNIQSIEKRITNAFEALNKLGRRLHIAISDNYFKLKLEELHLCYEFEMKKQQEKEEQRRIREEMREEAKLMKEIEDMKAKIAKEEMHFNQALSAVNSRLQNVSSESERELLEKEKAKIEQELAKTGRDKQELLYREQNTRAGYVYIISNIGSFGENVFKIGVTRRLDPQERIDELGDASVPFRFDVHAMIFSEDAPALESALHRSFESKRLNMVNNRREFFSVGLHDIEEVVRDNFNKPVDFHRTPEAPEYRQSARLRENVAASN